MGWSVSRDLERAAAAARGAPVALGVARVAVLNEVKAAERPKLPQQVPDLVLREVVRQPTHKDAVRPVRLVAHGPSCLV
eukprot:4558635-Pyramimonas_sp.AAC.1